MQQPTHFSRLPVLVAIAVVVVLTLSGITASEKLVRNVRAGATPPSPAGPGVGILSQSLIREQAEGIRIQEEAAARLERYQWVDRGGGRVRIPIERAMAIVAGEAQ